MRSYADTAGTDACVLVRQRWEIRGQVQGVGFRPFIYRLATCHGLTGFVRNDPDGVMLEVQGKPAQLKAFASGIDDECPPLAVVASRHAIQIALRFGEANFSIAHSTHVAGRSPTACVTVDTAICPDCLRELRDAQDRRYRHALINCTNCGPRYTITRDVPYDRPHTTMSSFAMCPQCRREYEDPGDRRFHAQPVACLACGPRLELASPTGEPLPGDAIREAAQRLREGQILAVKGIGGFHLAVRADSEPAVERLRVRKRRSAKPFALMAADLDEVRRLVSLSAHGLRALESAARPIVLAPAAPGTPVAAAVAPMQHRLGVMLPYTPIHHLLFGAGAPRVLVMTSGNVSDEPIVRDNDEAVRRLGPLCDAILWHDRPIERSVDDSVLIDVPGSMPLPVRRSRGYVPRPISLRVPRAESVPDGICVGADLKSVVAVVRQGEAILSQHLGDLTDALAHAQFGRTLADLQRLFGVKPRWVACDLHPRYLSTAAARRLATRLDLPLFGVQHHHAHAAAVLAEHGHAGPAHAIVCDGVGYGPDAAAWGGELLHVRLDAFERLATLRPLMLPGGDAAARDPRRSGLALLAMALGPSFASHPACAALLPDRREREMFVAMLQRGVNCVPSSGAGRYFDAVAAILGVCTRNSFEAEAPMALEAAAAEPASGQSDRPLFRLRPGRPVQIDLSPLVRSLLVRQMAGERASALAALFHDQFAWAWAEATVRSGSQREGRCVVLSGGCMCNQRFALALSKRLRASGFEVLRHERVPANDGGIALGQAAVAAARGERLADGVGRGRSGRVSHVSGGARTTR